MVPCVGKLPHIHQTAVYIGRRVAGQDPSEYPSPVSEPAPTPRFNDFRCVAFDARYGAGAF